jgi:hypothetical protein
MKRGRKPANGSESAVGTLDRGRSVKSTYVLPSVLKQNLAFFALEQEIDQSDVVRAALAEYLHRHGYEPTTLPKIHKK